MEIIMKFKFFIITTLIPISGIIILLFLRYIYLKFNNNDCNINGGRENIKNGSRGDSKRNNYLVNSIDVIQVILLSMCMIGFVGLFTSFSTWSYISVYSSIVLSVILLSIFTVYQLLNIYQGEIKKKFKEDFKNYNYNYNSRQNTNFSVIKKIKIRINGVIKSIIMVFQYKPKLSATLLCLSTLIGILIPVVLDGLCVCSQPVSISTRFTRHFQDSYCKENEICFVYLTLPENPSNSMILQVHTRNQPTKVLLQLNSINNSDISNQTFIESNTFKSVSEIIREESRYINYIEFSNLSESTTYTFNLTIETIEGNTIKSNNYGFKTFSSDSSGNALKFIVGGDLNLNNDAINLAKNAREFKPDFIVIGGDIAYENGIGSCYRRWDEKLSFLSNSFSYQVDNITILTPLLFSIGNHEAGEFFQTHNEVPFYFNYFIFNLGDSKVDQINQRLSYHIHKLPFNTSLASLDSCVVSTWEDQVDWLNSKWSNTLYNNTTKLVVYHHPIYTSRRNFNSKIPLLAQKSIIPLFDHYQVPFAFENHEHLFKRSKILYNNQIMNSNNQTQNHNNKQLGTVYVGDGSWGTSKYNQKSNDKSLPWYLEKRSQINHLWYVTINNDTVQVEAFASDGDRIDSIKYDRI